MDVVINSLQRATWRVRPVPRLPSTLAKPCARTPLLSDSFGRAVVHASPSLPVSPFQVQNQIYLLDFQKVEGDPFGFMSLCSQVFVAIHVCCERVTGTRSKPGFRVASYREACAMQSRLSFANGSYRRV